MPSIGPKKPEPFALQTTEILHPRAAIGAMLGFDVTTGHKVAGYLYSIAEVADAGDILKLRYDYLGQ